MLIQGQVGFPLGRAALGTNPVAPAGVLGELLESRLLPDYHTLVKNGLVFTSSLQAANPTGFVGAAAGTPLIGLYNPLTSGKDLVLLEAVVGIRTTGTGAVAQDFGHFGVNQGGVAVTGVGVNPRNMYSLGATGSATLAMQNVINTAALASFLLRPSFSVGLTTATPGVNITLLRDEIKGEIIVPPGGYYAFGAAASFTAASLDVALMWAEIPA